MIRTKLNVWLGALAVALMAGAAQAATAALDRAALLKLADSYLAALVAHDPGKVPLATDVKTVENVTRIKPGEGLWKTVSAPPTEFKIVAADPVTQEVGGLVVMQNDGKASQVGFRLKVMNGKIVEAEHLVVAMRDPNSPTLQKPRPAFPMTIPDEWADSHGRMIHIAKSYYDALDNNNGHLAPFAPDCERHENGFRTAPSGGPSLGSTFPGGGAPRPPGLMGMQDCTSQIDSGTFQYITTIDDRRVEIADTVTGLAIGFSHFHHPMTQKKFAITGNPDRQESDMSNQKPFDMPAMHIFKIWGGQLHEIEAIGIMMPLNSPTGWE
ncbi:MAG TPA: hypothetical protein VMC02_11130 [Steroidobacteraceae bacterium]|nr:hypothetical protein [Steroidobacteraceae bacterium]